MESHLIRNESGDIVGLRDASPLAMALADYVVMLRDGVDDPELRAEIARGLDEALYIGAYE